MDKNKTTCRLETVTLKQFKKLNELGFDAGDGKELPAMELARKWLRDEKCISIEPTAALYNVEGRYSGWYICMHIHDNFYGEDCDGTVYDSYEDALSAGIDKALVTFETIS